MEKIKLSEFLKENNCYDKFINNFDKDLDYEDWKEYVDRSIGDAFAWDKTPEGETYWIDIHNKWCNVEDEDKENDMLDFDFDNTFKDNIKDYGWYNDSYKIQIFLEESNWLYGIIINDYSTRVLAKWDNRTGVCYDNQHKLSNSYNIIPIKKEWYLDKDNIGKLMIDSFCDVRYITDIDDSKVSTHEHTIHHNRIKDWRLLTDDELDNFKSNS